MSATVKIIKEPIFKSLIATLSIILLSGTMFYKGAEDWSLLDSFYFSFVSLIPTGVNTGLVPETVLSKWFTMIYLFVGVGVMFMLLIIIGRAVVNIEKEEEIQIDKKTK